MTYIVTVLSTVVEFVRIKQQFWQLLQQLPQHPHFQSNRLIIRLNPTTAPIIPIMASVDRLRYFFELSPYYGSRDSPDLLSPAPSNNLFSSPSPTNYNDLDDFGLQYWEPGLSNSSPSAHTTHLCC